MQIILLEKVVNLGNLGDVVKVKDGYARNYLIPNGVARRATPDALAQFETKRAELEKAAAEGLQAQGFAVEKLMVRMPEGALKTIGDFPVDVALHTDVVVQVTVSVLVEH